MAKRADSLRGPTRDAKLRMVTEEIRKLLAEREPLYREIMTGELDVTNLTPDEAMVYITRMM